MGFFEKIFGTSNPIGGALSSAATLAGALSSIGQTKRQKQLMDYEQQLALEMYNKQFQDQQAMYNQQLADQRQLIQEEREYNDFDSVIQRASQAGINKLAAIGASGGFGIQSSAGSTPNPSTPSASSARAPGADNIGANLINAGSTLSAQFRQNALLDANIRKANAEADIAESEAKWSDKQLAQNYENSVTYKDFLDAGILDKKASARLSTAKAECEEISKDILSAERDVAQGTLQMRIEQFRTNLDLSLEELKRSKVDTEFKRERAIAELDNLNAMTDSITEHVSIDWANAKTNELNAHTALKQYGLSREEFVSLDRYRDNMVRLEEQDQVLREKLEKRRNTKDYIIHAADWINDRARIASEKERLTSEFVKTASSSALQLLGIAARFVK